MAARLTWNKANASVVAQRTGRELVVRVSCRSLPTKITFLYRCLGDIYLFLIHLPTVILIFIYYFINNNSILATGLPCLCTISRRRNTNVYSSINHTKVFLFVVCNGSGVELRTLVNENLGSNPVLRC